MTVLHILIPIFQPSNHWAERLDRILSELINKVSQDIKIEITVIDDGCTPKISQDQISSNFKIKFLENNINMGKGFSIRKMLSNCPEGELYLFTDVDIPYTIETMITMINAVQNGADLILAQRDKDYHTQATILRSMVSKFLRWVIRFVVGLQNSDTQGGLKVFNQKGRETLLQTNINRYLFDLQWVKFSEQKKLKIQSISAVMNPGIELGGLSFKLVLHELRNLLRICFS